MERPRSPRNFRCFALVRRDVFSLLRVFEFLSELNLI